MRTSPCLLLFLLLGGSAAAAPSVEAGWRALTDYRADDALRQFEQAAADPAAARTAKFGRAVALLTKQPVTASQVDESRRIFAELADSGQDDPAQGARFFLGRIAQHHQETPDAAEAARQFRRLLAEYPDSVWAQSALSRLGMLQLYALNSESTPAQRLAETERLLALAKAPEAKGQLHILIAEAIFFYRLPEQQALPHLLAAEPLGGYDRVGRTDLLVQIGELSRLGGFNAQAAKYYRMYLEENPRDAANYTVRQHLAEVEGRGRP